MTAPGVGTCTAGAADTPAEAAVISPPAIVFARCGARNDCLTLRSLEGLLDTMAVLQRQGFRYSGIIKSGSKCTFTVRMTSPCFVLH